MSEPFRFEINQSIFAIDIRTIAKKIFNRLERQIRPGLMELACIA